MDQINSCIFILGSNSSIPETAKWKVKIHNLNIDHRSDGYPQQLACTTKVITATNATPALKKKKTSTTYGAAIAASNGAVNS